MSATPLDWQSDENDKSQKVRKNKWFGAHFSYFSEKFRNPRKSQRLASPPRPGRPKTVALRKVAAGTGRWISKEDLWYLREGFGQVKSCVCIDYKSCAISGGPQRWHTFGHPL